MKNKVTAIALSVLLLAFRTLHGQNAECQKKCEEQKTRCSTHCLVMGADNTGCEERCVKESSTCLGSCQKVKPDKKESVDDDTEYEDNEDDDDNDDFDNDNDFDKDDDFLDEGDDL